MKLLPVAETVVVVGVKNHSMVPVPTAEIVCTLLVPEFWQKGPTALPGDGLPGLAVTFTVNTKLRGPSQVPINWLIWYCVVVVGAGMLTPSCEEEPT